MNSSFQFLIFYSWMFSPIPPKKPCNPLELPILIHEKWENSFFAFRKYLVQPKFRQRHTVRDVQKNNGNSVHLFRSVFPKKAAQVVFPCIHTAGEEPIADAFQEYLVPGAEEAFSPLPKEIKASSGQARERRGWPHAWACGIVLLCLAWRENIFGFSRISCKKE